MDKNFYYIILGLKENATKNEIENSYNRMLKKYHNIYGSSDDEILLLLNQARDILTNNEKRRIYDEKQKTYSKSKKHKFDISVILIVQFIALMIESIFIIKPDFGNLYGSIIYFLGFMFINNIVICAILGRFDEAYYTVIGTGIGAVAEFLILAIFFQFKKVEPETEAFILAIAVLLIPFIIYIRLFILTLKSLKVKKNKSSENVNSFVGFVISIVFLIICVMNIPYLYNYIYKTNTKTETAAIYENNIDENYINKLLVIEKDS
jgi:hypothetical protein